MTTLREAAQQALEALEADNSKLWPSEKRTTAITALRAALAEPVQEPVAWRYVPSDVWGDPIVTQDPKTMELARQYGRPIEPLYTAPPQRSAESVQEPQCNPHPKAPHGFLRNASHNEDRYVCECEGWEPYEAGYQAGMEAALRAQS